MQSWNRDLEVMQISFGLGQFLDKLLQLDIVASEPFVELLVLRLQLIDKLRELVSTSLLSGDDVVAFGLQRDFVGSGVLGTELKLSLYLAYPCHDVGGLHRADAVSILNVTSQCVVGGRKAIGRQ